MIWSVSVNAEKSRVQSEELSRSNLIEFFKKKKWTATFFIGLIQSDSMQLQRPTAVKISRPSVMQQIYTRPLSGKSSNPPEGTSNELIRYMLLPEYIFDSKHDYVVFYRYTDHYSKQYDDRLGDREIIIIDVSLSSMK